MVRLRKYELRHGEGSFYERADGTWVGVLEAGTTPQGTRRRITVKAKDKDVAWDKLTARRKTLMLHGTVAALQRDITVRAWMPMWLAITETDLRPKSQRAVRSYVTRWIIPTLGARKLHDLTAADARRLVKAALDAGRSPATAGKILETLQAACKRARADGYLVPEPVLLVSKPPAASKRRTAIPVDDALRLIEAAAKRPDASRWVAALLQGMRPGEVLGLTWDAVDLTAREIDVPWQLQALPYLDRAAGTFRIPVGYEARRLVGAHHLVRPKTAAGQRIIPLVPWLAESLAQWREVAPASPHGLVWPRADGRPQREDLDRAEWYALLDAAGVSKPDGSRYVLYEARHTTATLLLMGGVDPTVIKAIMGHSDVLTQDAYKHAPKSLVLSALSGVAETLGLTAPTPET